MFGGKKAYFFKSVSPQVKSKWVEGGGIVQDKASVECDFFFANGSVSGDLMDRFRRKFANAILFDQRWILEVSEDNPLPLSKFMVGKRIMSSSDQIVHDFLESAQAPSLNPNH